jgi:hypothetical protein
MKKWVTHNDVNDEIYQRINKLKLQKDKLNSLHTILSMKVSSFEEQINLYELMKDKVLFTYTSKSSTWSKGLDNSIYSDYLESVITAWNRKQKILKGLAEVIKTYEFKYNKTKNQSWYFGKWNLFWLTK